MKQYSNRKKRGGRKRQERRAAREAEILPESIDLFIELEELTNIIKDAERRHHKYIQTSDDSRCALDING